MKISDKLTKSNVSMVVGSIAVFFSAYLFVDHTYFRAAAANDLEIKLAGALSEQMKSQQSVFDKQIRLLDNRQLEQLRTSKALLENELKRTPNDRYLEEKLNIIKKQIEALERTLIGE